MTGTELRPQHESIHFKWRWVAVATFIFSSTLNYLDRVILGILAPLIMAELHFNLTEFGFVVSTFSIAYAASSLLTGWFLDRIGVNRGIALSVGWWSAASLFTGLVGTVRGLAICRAALGIGESAGVPAVGKLNGIYLKPEERALGAAVNQVGLSVGGILAPLWIGLAYHYSWRLPFIAAGLLGFVWIPLWWFVGRRIPPGFAPERRLQDTESGIATFGLLSDRNLLMLMFVNLLWMGPYSLWSNWTTIYLTRVHKATLVEAGHLVWFPQLMSVFGGFLGGWLSHRLVRRAVDVVAARQRVVYWSAGGLLITLLLPWAPSAFWAAAIISVSFFFTLSGSVNIYALPIDLYGAARSGLAIAALGLAFGILQTFISPIIGFLSDRHMYGTVVWIATVPQLAGAILLRFVRPKISLP